MRRECRKIMGKQIRNIIGYLIVAFLLLLCVFFYRQAFLVVLFLLVLLLPPVSYVLCRRSFEKLTAELDFSAAEAEKNLEVTLTIGFTNPTKFPLLHVECPLHISSPYYGSRPDTTYVLPAPAGSGDALSLPLNFHYCGLYQAEMTTVKAYDLLHFVAFSKEVDLRTQTMVFPTEKVEVSYHPSFYAEGFDEYETSLQTGNVSSNVTDIREYRPGDRLQRIHWKLSAKIDKLMVKENEAAASHQFYVLLELYRPAEHPEYLDAAVNYAYGVGEELLEHRENSFFGFYSGARREFVSHPVRSEEDLKQALREAYYEKPYTTANLALRMYQDSGMQKGTLIQVTHEGVMDEVSDT